ncbi:MAG: DUF4286 family protein [Flavobacteriales bacterium]
MLYNVTICVEALIYAGWLDFMRTNHIPKIFSTGCFSGYKICRMLDENTETYTVAVQYFADSIDEFEKYQREFAPTLQKEYLAEFGESAPAFRTVLHAIEEGEVNGSSETYPN